MGLKQNKADDILRGKNILPPCIHPDIVEVFECLKMDDSIRQAKPVEISTTFDTYKKFWKKKRENISSSMSGIHNGHYIAAA